MQVGDIVWFDPNKPNVWNAFVSYGTKSTDPFKVKIASVMHDGALDVTPIPFGGAPEVWCGTYQLVQVSQLSEDYPEASSADILWLIEQLDWLSVEQKKISMKELLSLFKESINV